MNLERIITELIQKLERRFYGKYRGIVVENADPKKLGRLKLQVPSILGDQVVTGWALPCLPYGGDVNQGFWFIPEVGAGVWVEFEGGDLEFPVWVGTFWSESGGESEVPKPNDTKGVEQGSIQDPPTSKIIKTKKGHTIQLEDADNAEQIIIRSQQDHVISLNPDGIEIIEGANTHTITFDDNGITLKSTQADLILKGKNIQLEAETELKFKGQTVILEGSNVNLTAEAKLEATGNPIHLNP